MTNEEKPFYQTKRKAPSFREGMKASPVDLTVP